MNLKYNIETKFNKDKIELIHGWETDCNNLLDKKTTEVINLREQAIKDALCKIGWLNPEDSVALLNACAVFQEGFSPSSMHCKQARKDFERIMLKYGECK